MWLFRLLTVRMKPIFGLYWTFRATGDVDAIRRPGPLILVCNHSSFLDPWWIGLTLGRSPHYLITRRWFDKSAFWHWFFSAQGVIPVEPGSPQDTVRAVCERLDQGDLVGIFPEGRISADGTIQRFQPGAALIAARSGVPVVPVGVRGGFDLLPRSRRIPRPGVIEVRVGTPIVFPDFPMAGPVPRRRLVETTDRLLFEVCRLAGQEHRYEILRRGRPKDETDVEAIGG